MFRKHTAAAVVILVFGVIGVTFLIVGCTVGGALRNSVQAGDTRPFLFIFCGVGALFLLTALVMLVYIAGNERKRQAVRARGQIVYATVTDVRRNVAVSVNGRQPYVVECRYQPDGEAESYLLKSQDYWNGHPQLSVGDQVPVYWDDYDKKHYTVDLDAAGDGPLIDLR